MTGTAKRKPKKTAIILTFLHSRHSFAIMLYRGLATRVVLPREAK